ncbi:hypothetical protein DB360_21620 [Enterobacter cloacae]|jgi:hypothetical protein|nr:hypothetical protein DB360_21620 [Enterobacter cloacae]
MFPLTPALSLKGEGAVCAGIILWGTLSPVGEGRGEGISPLSPLLPGGASLAGPTMSTSQPPPGFLLALLPPVRLRRKP